MSAATTTLTTAEFVETINNLRRANKGKWYSWTGFVNGKDVAIKGFETWLQIFRVNGLDCSNPMDQNVTQFKEWLSKRV